MKPLIKHITVGTLIVAWYASYGYILYRYKDDPGKLVPSVITLGSLALAVNVYREKMDGLLYSSVAKPRYPGPRLLRSREEEIEEPLEETNFLKTWQQHLEQNIVKQYGKVMYCTK